MTAEPREVTDPDGLVWTCVQAFAGLGNNPDKEAAARVAGSDRIRVVCTPSGGARSRHLELPPDWAGLNDGALLGAIAEAATD